LFVREKTAGRNLIVDPSCGSMKGHHHQSLVDLITALAPAPADLIVNRTMPAGAFPSETPVQALFKATTYDEPGLGPRPNGRMARRIWKLRRTAGSVVTAGTRLAQQAQATFAGPAAADGDWSSWRRKWGELEQVVDQGVREPVEHVVVPSADVELVCGLAEMRTKYKSLGGASIHARIITPSPALSRLSPASVLCRTQRAAIAQRLSCVHLYVETRAMQRHLASTYSLDSSVYPYLLVPPPMPAEGAPRTRASFGYFGGMRNEKGFQRLLPILTELVARLDRAAQPIRIVIHASDVCAAREDQLRRDFTALAGDRLKIEMLCGPLSRGDYERHFASVDAVLLPYTGARYALSGSGVMCEALALGKSVIYSHGLSFAADCDPSHAIEAGSDHGFATAIIAMAADMDRYRAGAADRAHRYRDEIKRCALIERLRNG
jgi:hypothetical protein